MSNMKTAHFKVEVTTDVAEQITNAAAKNNMTAGDVICECISQQLEQALRHRVLIQRQDDVDDAILELAQVLFILEPTGIARSLARKRVTVIDYPDGRLAIRHNGGDLPYRTFDKRPQVIR